MLYPLSYGRTRVLEAPLPWQDSGIRGMSQLAQRFAFPAPFFAWAFFPSCR
jgi:hypothetical protein